MRAGRLADLAWLLAGFLAAAAVSIAISRVNNGIAGIWLANVFAFAVLVRRQRKVDLVDHAALFGASFAVNLAFGSTPGMALLFALINAIHIGLALDLTRRFGGKLPLASPGVREFGTILLLGGVVTTSIAGLAFALAGHVMEGLPITMAGWKWVSANALGFAIFLPPLLFVSRRERQALFQPTAFLRTAGIAISCAVIACCLLRWGQFPFALAMLPLMVAAPRLSVLQLALVSCFTGAALVACAMSGFVPGLEAGTAAYEGGFPAAVAFTVAMPFMAGLFVHQITDDRKRIADLETRWNFALASARQGVWDADLKGNTVVYSQTWRALLGYEHDELDDDPDLWLKMAHPEDIERIAAADRDHMEGRAAYFEAEFRMRHKDGRWIWVFDRGKAVERDTGGKAIRAIGSITDITARKEAEERLAVSTTMLAREKERLRVTLQSIGDAVICTDASNRVTFMNPVAEKLAGVTVANALGKRLSRIYNTVDEDTGLSLYPLTARTEPGVDHNSRAVLLRNDGKRCSIRQVVSQIVSDRGEFSGLVIVFQDFTDARALQRQLIYAAAHDSLTGLANRSSFIRAMEDVVHDVRVGGGEHQFMFIDLDRFKAVNDTGGHAAGDALLKMVANTLRDAVRPQDVVARLGGDEFALMLKEQTQAGAMAVAETIIAAIGKVDFGWNGQSYRVGASIGIASLNADSGEADEVIARADEACYAAKAAGRGCAFMAADASSAQSPPLVKRVAGLR